jgi:hypothetical protein
MFQQESSVQQAVAEPGIAHATGEQKRAKKKLHENDPSFKA